MNNTRVASAVVLSMTLGAGCAKPPEAPAQLTEAQVTEHSKSLVPTGPWPQNDERGMANTIGNGTWMRCAYYLAQPDAKSYELSHIRSNTMPMSPFGQPLIFEATPSVSLPGSRHVFNGERVKGGEPGAQGTQMDAIGHFAYYDEIWDGKGAAPVNTAKYYAGYKQADVKPEPNSPLLKLGIEKAPPIITSAVLLDAKTYLGRGAALKPGELVRAADITGMLKAQGLEARGILPAQKHRLTFPNRE